MLTKLSIALAAFAAGVAIVSFQRSTIVMSEFAKPLQQQKHPGFAPPAHELLGQIPTTRDDPVLGGAAATDLTAFHPIKVTPYYVDPTLAQQGLSAQGFSRLTAGARNVGSGTVYYLPTLIPAHTTVSTIAIEVSFAQTSTTLFKVGLYDSARNLLASSADATLQLNTIGAKAIPLTSTYAVPTTGIYYLAFIEKHTAGSPQFSGSSHRQRRLPSIATFGKSRSVRSVPRRHRHTREARLPQMPQPRLTLGQPVFARAATRRSLRTCAARNCVAARARRPSVTLRSDRAAKPTKARAVRALDNEEVTVLHCYGSNWEDGMSTAVVRIDEHMLAGVKQIAAMRGTTPGDMLVRAWEEFVERHREEIASDFDHVAQAFRAGDREAVLDFMQKTRSARAEAAEARAAG